MSHHQDKERQFVYTACRQGRIEVMLLSIIYVYIYYPNNPAIRSCLRVRPFAQPFL